MIDSSSQRSGQRFTLGERDASPPEPWVHRIFLGPQGIRSPWRVLVAIALYRGVRFALTTLVASNQTVDGWLRSAASGDNVLTPGFLLFGEGIRTAAALVVGLAMAKLEDRTFSDYRVPWREALGRRFGRECHSVLGCWCC